MQWGNVDQLTRRRVPDCVVHCDEVARPGNTDRTLSDEDRLRVWIYIHRQRKEWDAKEKEMVAYRLVDLMGRSSAADRWRTGPPATGTVHKVGMA